MKTIISWLIENSDMVIPIAILAIVFIAVWAFKFGAPKGILWIEWPQKDVNMFIGTKQSREKVLRGNKSPKGIFQRLWYKIGIYWIGFFQRPLEFPWETRSVKIENDEMVGVDDPVINKHETKMPVHFPIAGVSRFVVKNGTVRFIFNLYCKVNDNEEVSLLAKIRTIPEWQEMILTTVYASVENFLKEMETQDIATEDIMGEDKRFKKELYKVNPGISARFHVTITHADIKFDEEANRAQAESLNLIGVRRNEVTAKIVVAEGDKKLAEIARDTAGIKLEQTKKENEGVIDLEKQLKAELKESYGTHTMAKAIEKTGAHTVVLQTDKAVVPVSTT